VEAIQGQLPAAEMERAMKIQEVVLKATAGKLKWWEAAEIIGVSDRTMRRWRQQYAEHGYIGLWDYRKRRPRRPLPGMLLHIDGSEHCWFGDERRHELIVIMDDAASEICYAQLVEAESTHSVMVALREVIETRGLFCSLNSDRAGHFFVTPKAGEKVDRSRPTQAGRALQELGVRMIAACSPQARGRSERNFGTWQGRLPQELRLRGIVDLERANEFLRNEYIGEFNRRFAVPAAQKGTAFVRAQRKDLGWVFSAQHERTVSNDNTVALDNRVL